MWRAASLVIMVGGVLSFSLTFMYANVQAVDRPPKPAVSATAASDTPAPPAADVIPEPTPTSEPIPTPPPVHPSFGPLAQSVGKIVAGSGGQVGVSLIELGGTLPTNWSSGGATQMDAASTYKLPALMEEAQLIAANKLDPAGTVCFADSDWEDGWFDDYAVGQCYSRAELANRAGIYSDNTAGHMLVRDLGGAAALNSYAASLGALDSTFFDVNQTTSDDLARLLAAEATGKAGAAQAQAWLYPNLSKSRFEAGIPAGVPAGTTVFHKTGELGPEVNDAAIVSGGKNGSYVLTVMTDGPGGDAAWSVIAQISAAVWAYESVR
jgi:beta-lactamase class A